MIVGKINDLELYKGLSENVAKAIEYVKNNDLLALAPGRYEVDGDNLFVLRETYVAKELKDCTRESHNRYIDLQLVLKGKEAVGYCDRTNPALVVTLPYDEKADITKYSCDEGISVVELEDAFYFAFPNDVHLPKVKMNDNIVEKAIVKIKY